MYVFLLALLHLLQVCPSTTTANDTKNCTEDDQFSCLSNVTQDNTVITFNNGDKLTLTSPLNVSKVDNLRISGSGAVITCTGQATGLKFFEVRNLSMENLHFRNCGWARGDRYLRPLPSINVSSCSNVTIRNVTIEGSKGTGLNLSQTGGQVLIENCTFLTNGVSTLHHDSESLPVSQVYHERHGPNGGGLHLKISVSCGSFLITHCKFFNNTAVNGGGLFIALKKSANKNNVTVFQSTFFNNTGHNGGGGVQLKYAGYNNSKKNNELLVQDCIFESNTANHGGGASVSVRAVLHNSLKSSLIKFSRCLWTKNSAELGMAVDIDSGTYIDLQLADCIVTENCPTLTSNFVVNTPRSVFVITAKYVLFSGRHLFQDNCGSAIETFTTKVVFNRYSDVKFIRNKAMFGGGLDLLGRTAVHIQEHSRFLFEGNTAEKSGGAISSQIQDKHSYLANENSCFMRYNGTKPNNVTLVFKDNYAGGTKPNHAIKGKKSHRYRGNSIYASSFLPCLLDCANMANMTNITRSVTIEEALGCIGNFSFHDKKRIHFSTAADHFARNDISSDPMCHYRIDIERDLVKFNHNFSRSQPDPLEGKVFPIIPGKNETLPLKLVDQLCNEVVFVVSVRVLDSKLSTIFVNPAHSVITDNHLTLFGQSGDSGQIRLYAVGATRAISLMINVSIEYCPPGYVLVENACVCSSHTSKPYIGIKSCDATTFRALVKRGYWMGYVKSSATVSRSKEESLASIICPRGFCRYSGAYLPANSSEDLNTNICSNNRTGDICGMCRQTHSAGYHSSLFSCNPNDLCYLGWLFYILSELIPVTLFFLVVIYFNISFTSGPLNGVIFFMQVMDTMEIDAENFIRFNDTTELFSKIYKFVYRIFSLNMFALEELSFCLWPNASALDMLAFRYVTIIYSLLLVFATILLFRMCNCRRRLTATRKLLSLKHSVIHGLSTFLVMTYADCTRVSLMIITDGIVTVGYNSTPAEHRAFYFGEYRYLGLEHLKYALPAIFFIMSLVVIPPLLLMAYPLCYRLFALLRIEESKFVQITCKVIPLENIKPLFDSIQSAFKDRYRFFAGLYFAYRLCLLMTFAYADTFRLFYTITAFQLLCIITFHTVCRPYKSTWHNILDALLFLNLATINAISFYNYQSAVDYEQRPVVGSLQHVLIFLPLVYLALYMVYRVVLRLKNVCKREHTSEERAVVGDNSDFILDTLDSRNFDESLVEKDAADDYVLLEHVSNK